MRKVIIMVVLAVAVLTAACTPPLAMSSSDRSVATATYPVDEMLRQATDEFGHSCYVLEQSILGWLSGITDTYGADEYFALSQANQDAAWSIMADDAGPYTQEWMDHCYPEAMGA